VGNGWRQLRRRILTPDMSATSLDVRGFHKKSPAAQELLETIGRMFLTGYGHAAEARRPAEAEPHLEKIPVRFRGFAYEGAGMGFTMRDRLPLRGSTHLTDFLAGRAAAHDYMVYIGMGWAMARLPRFRWPSDAGIAPLMKWFALDGYGFHQAYFRTRQYVTEQFQATRFPWPAQGPSWYANRAIDHGIGRALWFVCGTDAELTATTIEKYAQERQPDLYAGAGLAATYAGGADADELTAFYDRSGECRPQVAQGSAFAAEARIRAGLLVPHTETATQVFCGLPPEKAAQITHDMRPDKPGDDGLPAYEVWRQRIAGEFVSLGRC
jgi:hypothetical protein